MYRLLNIVKACVSWLAKTDLYLFDNTIHQKITNINTFYIFFNLYIKKLDCIPYVHHFLKEKGRLESKERARKVGRRERKKKTGEVGRSVG